MVSAAIPASAGILVTIPDAECGWRSTGRADVLISSDAAQDRLAGFVVHFTLRPQSGNTSRILEFLDLGSGVPVDGHLLDSRYVFASTGSAAQEAPPAGSIGPGPTYSAVDVSHAPQGVFGPFERLLVTLHFDASQLAPPAVGDLFVLELDLATSEFLDPDGQPLPITAVRQGVVLVTPEPDVWWLAGLGTILCLLCKHPGIRPRF